MSTRKETIEFILQKLGHAGRFVHRAMFGEYALYADGKVVALVCDDTLYVKIRPETAALESLCETGEPYPGAKPHYIIEEDQISRIEGLSGMLFEMAQNILVKKKKAKK